MYICWACILPGHTPVRRHSYNDFVTYIFTDGVIGVAGFVSHGAKRNNIGSVYNQFWTFAAAVSRHCFCDFIYHPSDNVQDFTQAIGACISESTRTTLLQILRRIPQWRGVTWCRTYTRSSKNKLGVSIMVRCGTCRRLQRKEMHHDILF